VFAFASGPTWKRSALLSPGPTVEADDGPLLRCIHPRVSIRHFHPHAILALKGKGNAAAETLEKRD